MSTPPAPINIRGELFEYALTKGQQTRKTGSEITDQLRRELTRARRDATGRVEELTTDLDKARKELGLLKDQNHELSLQLETARSDADDLLDAAVDEIETYKQNAFKLAEQFKAFKTEACERTKEQERQVALIRKELKRELKREQEERSNERDQFCKELINQQKTIEELTEQLKSAKADAANTQADLAALQASISPEDKKGFYFPTLEKLDSAERRVEQLKQLETELEASVKRSQRAGLSRKSMYHEGDKNSMMAPALPQNERDYFLELIHQIGQIEDLIQLYDDRWYMAGFVSQLRTLNENFIGILENHSIFPFCLAEDTVLTAHNREAILLITPEQYGDPKLLRSEKKKKATGQTSRRGTTVYQTIRSGFVFRDGGQKLILRKAEVVVK